jgi:acyl-CoA thioesterase-1
MVRMIVACVVTLSTLWLGTIVRAQEKPKLPRVLILGDSISLGYTESVRKHLKGKAEVLRPAENCQHTGYGLARIKNWLGDGKWDVIHFNWGIWDTHMLNDKNQLVRDDAKGELHIRHTPKQYRENLTKLVETMEKTGAKLIWASTTPIMSRTGARFDDIKNLNAVAAEIMKERKIAVNDLYTFALPNVKEWQSGDKVHFNAKGNEELGKKVSERILEVLK